MQRYIWLNDVKIPIKGAVVWHRITPFPNQFMTTSPTENDYTPTRKQNWGNLKGGLGKDKWTPEDNDRYAEANGIDASQEIQTLSPFVTTMGSFGVEPVKIIKYKGKMWAIGHQKITYWTGSAWKTPAVKTNFDNPTDAITFYGTA